MSMKPARTLCAVLGCIAAITCACRTLPYREQTYREIREADIQLLQAQQLESHIYAPETYFEAQLTLKKARDLLNSQKYAKAKSLAQKAADIGEQACEESQDERLRIKTMAERLLFRGEEIWNQYEMGDEKEYAPEELIEIKQILAEGRTLLDNDRYMEALKAVQKSHQRLAHLPQAIENGKVSLLEAEKKWQSSTKTADEIIQEARQTAETLLAQARAEAENVISDAHARARKARRAEFERMYPSTYRVKKGETLNDIAKRREIFNDAFMWPLIYKANRDQIRDPRFVYPGQVLTIPRDLTFEEIIEARRQAEAAPPFIPPHDAYRPDFYRSYFPERASESAPAAADTPQE